MKRFYLLVLAFMMAVFSAGALADKFDRARGLEDNYGNPIGPKASGKLDYEHQREDWARKTTPYHNDSLALKNSAHITQYGFVPMDLRDQGIGNFRCNQDGQKVTEKTGGGCTDFQSASEGTLWRVRFSPKEGESVFKLEGGRPQLWVKYRPGYRDVSYASPGAQQYAATHGSGTAVAHGNTPQQTPQVAQGACDNLSGKARAGCEAASALAPAIGGLLKW